MKSFVPRPKTGNRFAPRIALGNLVVAFDSTYTTPTLGDSWVLFDYDGTLSQNGGFSFTQNLLLPDISSSGYQWQVDTTSVTNGQLIVTIIPEPSLTLLAAGGMTAFATRRRRK